MDAYLSIFVKTTRPLKQFGDIIEVKTHPGSYDDRKATVVIKITDIPGGKAAKIKQRLTEPLKDADPDNPIIMFRKLYLFGLDKGPQAVKSYIASNYPALATKLQPYLDPTVSQPESEIPSVSWGALKNAIWYFMAGRLADLSTEVEG